MVITSGVAIMDCAGCAMHKGPGGRGVGGEAGSERNLPFYF